METLILEFEIQNSFSTPELENEVLDILEQSNELQSINQQINGVILTREKRGNFTSNSCLFYKDIFIPIIESLYGFSKVQILKTKDYIKVQVREIDAVEDVITYDINYIYPLSYNGCQYRNQQYYYHHSPVNLVDIQNDDMYFEHIAL